jgi:hypothetical protein
MGIGQRISYVPVEQMDERMQAEMDRCRREGTPRPESSAVRAHVPAAFWAFADAWRDMFRQGVCDHRIKELCRVYISRSVNCEYCGNQRALTFGQQSWLRLLNIEHHEVLPGTSASMAPGFETAESLAASKSSPEYWASR